MRIVPSNLFENRRRGIGAMPVIAACCGMAAAVTLGLWTAERNQVRALDQNRTQTAAALDQAKSQIQDLTNRLNALAEKSVETPEPPAPIRTAPRAAPSASRAASPASRKRPARAAASDPRLDRLQGQLTEAQKQLASTRDELASTRDDLTKDKEELDGKINSTRDDLNGSIARTHDEVVALQRRGEQNIYEFKLTKSKDIQRVGPLSISLRSTSVKHKTYDLTMMVDDNALGKKHVNIYEPVWITLGDRPQPVQLVVNHVEKNQIEGYVSEPKYKKSELAANSGQPAQAPQQQLSTRDQSAAKN